MARDPAFHPPKSPFVEAMAIFLGNRAAMAGLIILAVVILASLIGPSLYGVDPKATVNAPFLPPMEDVASPMGTDYIGRDVLAGILSGGPATIMIGTSAALVAVLIGITLGALAGYYGGLIDTILMRFTEFFQVLPALLFAMVLMTLFTPSLRVTIIGIGLVMWPPTARLARAEFMKLRNMDYVRAERAMGARDRRIIWRVILPNAMPPLIAAAALVVGVSILFEAGLSFLGLGDPNIRSWGEMIGSNRDYIFDCPWAVFFPGIAIFLTVLGVSLVGDGLNDAMNPRFRER
ncbi:MAG: ABC transporter permease [Rhodobacteraceae bacterium]|jgi:peptide/nickel transport system permease protein|nr:ABC transporter permease [Paracoccaceae bacterium]